MAVKWIFLWMGPGLSKVEVIHCLVRGRRTPENRPRCLLQRGQGNFELAANFGYDSRGSADPRESLRRRRISKLALSAHKVLSTPNGTGACRCAFKAGGKKIRVKYFRHPDGKCLVCNIWYDGKTVRECIKSCQRCSMRERRWLFIGGRSF